MKAFFFEKKKQDTFASAVAVPSGEPPTARKRFLVLFFKKELLLCLVPSAAWAQYRPPAQHFPTVNVQAEPITGNAPVTFQSDSVTYDKEHGLVIADGHVEAWQNDHVLKADRVTFDRNTNVAAAYGHVVIVEPDGQVLFADYAELSQGMREGVLTGMRVLMEQNARLAANGARRIDAKLNTLSRGVYSACDVCAQHPERAPLWQVRAYSIVQDLENKRIEYKDAYIDALGIPVVYLPFFSMPDPSVKRQSGLLIPSIGAHDEYLGTFVRVPYFLVLNDQSDVLLTATLATLQGPQLESLYHQAFNNGELRLDGAIARDRGTTAGFFFGHGLFALNDTFRYGFDINLGSSVDYLRDFQVPGYGAAILPSQAFIEGFGVGAYAKLDIRTYQGLNSTINQSLLPYVLPRFEYSYFGEPDGLGGRLSFDTTQFNILRRVGTNDQQAAGRLQWDRPLALSGGAQVLFTAQATGVVYNANFLDGQPNYQNSDVARGAHGQGQVAVRVNWPFARDAGSLGTQVIEPIVQVIAAPQSGNSPHDSSPNEDSLDYEFTDATLFALNRFQGYDRSDGGVRVNAALRGEWNFLGGQKLEGLVGASYQQHIDLNQYPQFQPDNGFDTGAHLSDIVGRVSFVPNKYVDFTTRTRVDHRTGDIRFVDAITGFGLPVAHFGVGYLYSASNPYLLYLQNFNLPNALTPLNTLTEIQGTPASVFTPRQEVRLNVSSHVGAYTLNLAAIRNLETGAVVSVGGDARYENECVIFDIFTNRRFVSIAGDRGDTTVVFTLTLKTLGSLGVNG